MLLILNTLQIIDLGNIIAEINITNTTILTITMITITIIISYGERNVTFLVNKVIALINIQMMSN